MDCTILIPTYNYGHYIQYAIESVVWQCQPTAGLEIIVIDDGSNDNTQQIVEKLKSQYHQIMYVFQPNLGKAAATRKGVELASGDIIFNLDADDYFLPGKIEKTLELFKKYPSLVHVGSPAKILYEDGRPATVEQIPPVWLNKLVGGNELLHFFFARKLLFGGGSCFAARSSALKTITWHDKIDMYTDEWLLIETLLKGDTFLISEPLSVWRVHGKNYSASPAAEWQIARHQRMEESSAAILQLLAEGSYPRWLVKLYRLKHQVRRMVWLEETRQKSIADIMRFLSKDILGGHSIQTLKQYHAFNRLIPLWIQTLLKS